METVLPTIQLTGVVVGFPLLAWLFGWSVLGRFTRLDREERFAASWGISFAFLALMQFVAFATETPPFVPQVVTLLVLVGVSLLCRVSTEERADDGPTVAPLLLGFGLVYLNLVLVTALLPCFRGSMWYFDWWMHYDSALVFLGDRPTDESWANGWLACSRCPCSTSSRPTSWPPRATISGRTNSPRVYRASCSCCRFTCCCGTCSTAGPPAWRCCWHRSTSGCYTTPPVLLAEDAGTPYFYPLEALLLLPAARCVCGRPSRSGRRATFWRSAPAACWVI